MIRLRKARLSAGIVLGAATLVTPLVAISGSASAAPTVATTYHGTATSSNRVTHAASVSGLKARISSFSPQGPRALTHLAVKGMTTIGAADAASAGASALGGPNGVLQSFNGLSDKDQANVNGGVGVGDVTPPDQGLCIGNDALLPGDPKVVFEAINDAVRETTPSGTRLRPDFSLATLFDDPFAQGDVRCEYDASAHTFYFTEIGYPPGGPSPVSPLPLNTTDEVAVWNANGVAVYAFDTSRLTTTKLRCFGDQPKTGFDNNAVIISTDQFCGRGGNTYEGALAVVISKAQLVSEATVVDAAELGPVSLDGNPVTGLDPAINTGSGTGYFVNSVPFLANGDNNPVGTTLGVWTLSNSADVVSDPAAITLAGTSIDSESYAFPVPATSTGNGSTTSLDGLTITSETALNPDDSRISGPVSVTHTLTGGTLLWTALDAAVTPAGDNTVRDGVAWFAINAGSQSIAQQGYVTAAGANLIYPAIGAPALGTPVAVFTITSKTINPSAAYSILGSNRIITVAAGAGPHKSFSDAAPFFDPRWGDYSFAQVDPSGAGVWLATEYIPPAGDQDPIDNWGTSVFQINQFSFGF
jgi:hypothetical protein